MKVKQFIILLISGYIVTLLLQIFLSDNHKSLYNLSVFNGKPNIYLLWWTPMVEQDRIITCKNNIQCTITANRTYLKDKKTVIIFYGTSLNIEDLPLPKRVPWAIFHEESPKNLPLFINRNVQRIFDFTSTFSRFSSMPVTFQYLKDIHLLISKKYFKEIRVKNELLHKRHLSPVLYLQSDSDTPIERDKYVAELMKYVAVDSYGACLNNRKIPDKLKLNTTYDLYSEDLMEFVSQYKFVIAIENAKCDDYITEKLWRSLIVGSIPIYLGSPTIIDWLPNNKSAILVDNFRTIQHLGKYINALNENDDLYNTYMDHKLKQQISNKKLRNHYSTHEMDDYVFEFECFLCDNIHRNVTRIESNQTVYNCNDPVPYNNEENVWINHWKMGNYEAEQLLKNMYN